MATESDNFNRANENPLAGNYELLDNPDAGSSTAQLLANEVKPAAVGESVYGWKSSVTNFGDDQDVDITIGSFLNFDVVAPAARYTSASGGNGYYVSYASDRVDLVSVVNGTSGNLAAQTGLTIGAADKITLDCSGTTIRVLENDVERISITNADHASGQPGIYFAFGSSNGTTGDNWNATDGVAAGAGRLLLINPPGLNGGLGGDLSI